MLSPTSFRHWNRPQGRTPEAKSDPPMTGGSAKFGFSRLGPLVAGGDIICNPANEQQPQLEDIVMPLVFKLILTKSSRRQRSKSKDEWPSWFRNPRLLKLIIWIGVKIWRLIEKWLDFIDNGEGNS